MGKSKVVNTVIMALCELGVGILLLVNPIGFTQWVFIVLGGVLLMVGVLETVAYFRMEPGLLWMCLCCFSGKRFWNKEILPCKDMAQFQNKLPEAAGTWRNE